MVTEPGINAIKGQIVTLLKANASLWDDPTHTTGFQKIEVGMPENGVFSGLAYPVCYVTNDPKLETDKPYGPVISNAIGTSLHEFRFRIIFFDQKEDGQAAEASLDSYYKTIKEVLKSNNNLAGLVIENFPIEGSSFALEMNGRPLDGRIIIVRCRVGSN